ncbi:MAG: I78 family peptidase inhibitor [Pseudooceanicola atlanticus]
MSRMRQFALIAALLPLAACMEDDTPPPADTADACGAAALKSLVGQDRAAVTEAGLTPDRKTRIFGPGAALTMDFREDRVNVELDAADRVVRIYCG